MFLGYLFSLIAAALWGASHVGIKLGVTYLAPPLVGATFSTFVGAGVFSALAVRDRGSVMQCRRKAVLFVALAGMFAAIALLFQFLAFSKIPVIIASPLSCTYPIVTAALAHLFLKQTERVTPRVVVGAVCVVIGGALITLGRP